MNILPWRVRAFVSNHAPLVYHLIANLGTPRRSKEYWDTRLAESGEARNWPAKDALIEGLTSQKQRILDVACGNGGILKHLRSRGYRNLEGLEISEYAVTRLRSEGLTMHQGKLPTLPMSDASYDVVVASQVLEHVIRRGTFAREIARVLKPNGRALIFVPNDCLGPIDEPEHVIKYNESSLRRFLAKVFTVIDVAVIRDPNYPMTILFAHVMKKA